MVMSMAFMIGAARSTELPGPGAESKSMAVEALPAPRDSSPEAFGRGVFPRRRSIGVIHPVRDAALVFLGFLAVSSVFYILPVLGRFTSTFAAPLDARLYVWALGWWPYAIHHGIDPFSTHAVWAPQGLDLAWSTAVPGPSLVLAPISVLAGGVAALNVATALATPLAGWAAFLLCRRLCGGRLGPAVVGAALVAFSPYMTGQLRGHLDLYLIFPVLLALYLVQRFIEGTMSGPRFAPLLGLVCLAEASISLEVLLTACMFGALALVGAWLFGPEVRPRLRQMMPWLLASAAGVLVASSAYIYELARDYSARPLWPHPGHQALDLLSLVVPSRPVLIGGNALRSISNRFPSKVAEDGGYLPLPLLVGLILAARRLRRDRLAVGALLIGLAAVVLALGARLSFMGRLTAIALPWAWVRAIPLMRMSLAPRLTLYLWICIGVVVARWLAAASRPWLPWVLVGLSLILLVPNPAIPMTEPARVPALFTSAQIERLVPREATVLIVSSDPPAGTIGGSPMLDQAQAHYWFDMAQGYTGPPPEPFASNPVWRAIGSGRPGRLGAASFGAYLSAHSVLAVLVAPHDERRWAGLLRATLKDNPVLTGGMFVWERAAAR
jgi:hypothetical protein